ncbi:putative serine-rich protein-like protein [Cucumis melo var. makuwa]|uniref:Uncharacterized protein LOC103496492 n=2 Tax=Cucumis melo TaxID=3656 RepID=A0A1S4E2K6_CUCME|nr:uncharacterized protein LOC103496492 [Cucumis melo]KAA0063558.1 putative serine-rich protein C215.13-like protein [Cucumis melo var. makuwa]TYJ97884.1 putative serine-rich protein-like protein [Cucumis melo var. makuwa]
MAATSRRSSASVLRSLSPSGRFYGHRTSSSSAFASSTSTFSSRSATSFFCRSTSPSRVNLHGSPSVSVPSVRFSLDRATSPNRSVSVSSSRSGGTNRVVQRQSSSKRTCMCSPTTHPGSFRCSLHKGIISQPPALYSPSRLNARRSAMTNSLVRIGGVEGDLVKRALAALIRPSSHQQRRRVDFRPKRSRLSIMSKADETL